MEDNMEKNNRIINYSGHCERCKKFEALNKDGYCWKCRDRD